jgi:hypothetical protein
MKSSFFRVLIISFIMIGIVFLGATLYARNVRRGLHPNLAAAQTFIEKAISKVSAAQMANEFDMNGHAAKAKNLLDQAYVEIKLAALAANANR